MAMFNPFDPLSYIEPRTHKDFNPSTLWGGLKLVVYFSVVAFIVLDGLTDLLADLIGAIFG